MYQLTGFFFYYFVARYAEYIPTEIGAIEKAFWYPTLDRFRGEHWQSSYGKPVVLMSLCFAFLTFMLHETLDQNF